MKFVFVLEVFGVGIRVDQFLSVAVLTIKSRMEGYSDADLVVRVGRLQDVEDYDEECVTCQKPNLLHNGACVRSEKVEEEELLGIWKEFRVRMKVVMKRKGRKREKAPGSGDY